MKPREKRHKVMIRARIRTGASWCDACILDLSSRGLSLHTSAPPPRGSYLEVRRGRQIIVARVMWADNSRLGLQAQGRVPIDAIIKEPDGAAGPAPGDVTTEPAFDRRVAARVHATRHDHSRLRARAFEFLCLAILGAAGAMTAFGAVGQVFAAPLAAVEQALAAQ